MLTSEEAKDKLCPYSFPYSDRVNCKGNECPKWRVAAEFNEKAVLCWNSGRMYSFMAQIEDCRDERNLDSCFDCPEAYGYCGG